MVVQNCKCDISWLIAKCNLLSAALSKERKIRKAHLQCIELINIANKAYVFRGK